MSQVTSENNKNVEKAQVSMGDLTIYAEQTARIADIFGERTIDTEGAAMIQELEQMLQEPEFQPDLNPFRRAILELLLSEFERVNPEATNREVPEQHAAKCLELLEELRIHGISAKDEAAVTLIGNRALKLKSLCSLAHCKMVGQDVS